MKKVAFHRCQRKASAPLLAPYLANTCAMKGSWWPRNSPRFLLPLPTHPFGTLRWCITVRYRFSNPYANSFVMGGAMAFIHANHDGRVDLLVASSADRVGRLSVFVNAGGAWAFHGSVHTLSRCNHGAEMPTEKAQCGCFPLSSMDKPHPTPYASGRWTLGTGQGLGPLCSVPRRSPSAPPPSMSTLWQPSTATPTAGQTLCT